jgi:hypothetical protein
LRFRCEFDVEVNVWRATGRACSSDRAKLIPSSNSLSDLSRYVVGVEVPSEHPVAVINDGVFPGEAVGDVFDEGNNAICGG